MRLLRAGAALAALAVYLAVPTRNYYWDGVSFAQTIEDAGRLATLLHPNHLVYNVLGWAAYHALGGAVRALYVLQAIDAAFAALAVFLLFGILARTWKSERAALLGTALFAFSGTWWRFATDADAYIPSVALLLACATLLLRDRPRPVALALLHTGAMLLHQLAFWFFPAALYALWWRSARRAAAVYAALAGALTLGAYAAAWRASSTSGFWAWMTSHASDASFSFGLVRNTAITLRSWFQLFAAGRPSLVRFTSPLTILLLALCAVCLLALARALPGVRWRPIIRHPELFRFALLWLASYALFLFFWLPHNTFYKLFALPAIVLLAASCWQPGRAAAPAVALLALSNLTFAILPYSHPSANPAIAFALDLQAEGIVYFQDFNTDDWFARYFNPRTQWKPLETTAAIEADLRAGRTVWLDTTALDRLAAAGYAPRGEWRQLVNSRHRIRFLRLAR